MGNSSTPNSNRGTNRRGKARNALPGAMQGRSHGSGMLAARQTRPEGRMVNSNSNSVGGHRWLRAVPRAVTLQLSSAASSVNRAVSVSRDKGNAKANPAEAAVPISRAV